MTKWVSVYLLLFVPSFFAVFAGPHDHEALSGEVTIQKPKSKGLYAFDGPLGPDHWAKLMPEWGVCDDGKAQSPINFVTSSIKKGSAGDITVHYEPVVAAIENLGTTIQVPYINDSHIELNGKRYDLLQFHVHTPSEHTVDGMYYPMEIHFVHKHSDSDFAVLGVMVKEGKANQAIQSLGKSYRWDQLIPSNENTLFTLASLQIDGNALLPTDRSFYRYNGSLTTPPCVEVVTWSVFQQPIEMSAA